MLPQPLMRNQRVRGRHQRNIGRDHHIISNVNIRVIQHAEVVVREEILPDVGVDAIVELHRRLEVEPLPDAPQNGPHQPRNALVVLIQRIHQAAGLVRLVLGVPQLHGVGPKQQPRFDSLGFFHVVSSFVAYLR